MIPKALYETLPYLYFIVGALSVAGLDVSAGRMSGAMLVGASVIIFKMRRDYRKGDFS